MPNALPIACSLDSGALTARKAAMAELGQRALLRTTMHGGTAELEFRRDAERLLQAIVAAERRCCAFLSFELCTRGDVVALSISGPSDAADMVVELAEAFAQAADERGSQHRQAG